MKNNKIKHKLENNLLTTKTRTRDSLTAKVTTWAELQKALQQHQKELLKRNF